MIRFLFALLLTATASLHALDYTIEYYPESSPIPDEFAGHKDMGDLTVIRLQNLPHGRIFSFSEVHPLMGKREMGKFKTYNKSSFALVIESIGYTPGLRIKYTVQDIKNKQSETISIIPARIHATSPHDGAEIEAELLKLVPPTYAISARGFSPSEHLTYTSNSYRRKLEGKFEANTPVTIKPKFAGYDGGVADFKANRTSGETLTLQLPWGEEWLKYILYYDENGNIKSAYDTIKNKQTM